MILKKTIKSNEVLKAVLYYIVNTQLPEDLIYEVSASFSEDDDGSVDVVIEEKKEEGLPLINSMADHYIN